MNKQLRNLASAAATALGIFAVCGWNTLPNDDTSIPGPATFGKAVNIGASQLYVNGTNVTVTANQLNLAGATVTKVGTFTNGQTIVLFGVTFSSPPYVQCQFTNAISATLAPTSQVWATSITTTSFVPNAYLTIQATNCVYEAHGSVP